MCLGKLRYLILSSLILSGCLDFNGQGSGNVFDDPPDCYYDSLFGCGTFDIPGGSSWYGYQRAARAKAVTSKRNAGAVPNFSGNWNGVINRSSNSCSFATPNKIQGNFAVEQRNKRVTARLQVPALKAYPLRGSANKSGLQASTFGSISLCSFSANAKLTSSTSTKGNIALSINLRCPFQKRCSLRYEGVVRR